MSLSCPHARDREERGRGDSPVASIGSETRILSSGEKESGSLFRYSEGFQLQRTRGREQVSVRSVAAAGAARPAREFRRIEGINRELT